MSPIIDLNSFPQGGLWEAGAGEHEPARARFFVGELIESRVHNIQERAANRWYALAGRPRFPLLG